MYATQLQRCVHIVTWLLLNLLTQTLTTVQLLPLPFLPHSLSLLWHHYLIKISYLNVSWHITHLKYLLKPELAVSPFLEQVLLHHGSSNVVLWLDLAWVTISNHSDTQCSPQLNLIIAFVVLVGYIITSCLISRKILVWQLFLSIHHNGTNMLCKPEPWVIQALAAPVMDCGNHKAQKRYFIVTRCPTKLFQPFLQILPQVKN